MTRVALVVPDSGLKLNDACPPLNLGCLASYLRKCLNDVEIKIVDGVVGQPVLEILRRFNPDIVGVTATTPQAPSAYKLGDWVKQNLPYALTVMGGIHASALPKEALEHFDCVVVGEGEKALVEIVEASECGYRWAGIIEGDYIRNLDEIPMPAYDLIDVEAYLKHGPPFPFGLKNPKTVSLVTSRGCPFHCPFCLPKGTLILNSSLQWKRIEDVKTGDYVISIVDKVGHFRKSRVIHTFQREAKIFKITTTKGVLFSTKEHPWLAEHWRWRPLERFRVGQYMRPIADRPIESLPETMLYMNGYLAGATLGDGTLYYRKVSNGAKTASGKKFYDSYQWRLVGDYEMLDYALHCGKSLGLPIYARAFCPGKNSPYRCNRQICTQRRNAVKTLASLCSNSLANESEYRRGFLAGFFDADGGTSKGYLRFSNKDRELLSRVYDYLRSFGFNAVFEYTKLRMLGGTPAFLAFMALVQPKVVHKRDFIYRCKRLYAKAKIVSIEPMKENIMVFNLETEHGNFVADGFISHNCRNSSRKEPVRYFSARRVVDEIEYFITKHHVDSVFFNDDEFLINKARLFEIKKLLVERGLLGRFVWGCQARVKTINEETLRLAKSMGCVVVSPGFESYNPRMLEFLKCGTTKIEDNDNALRVAEKVGMTIGGSFIFGTPTETLTEMRESWRWFESRDSLAFIGINTIIPYPNTRIWEICRAKGLLPEKLDYTRLVPTSVPEKTYIVCDTMPHETFNRFIVDIQRVAWILTQLRLIRRQSRRRFKDFVLLARFKTFWWMLSVHPFKFLRAFRNNILGGVPVEL